jgi:hypothetical protein
VRTLLNKLRSKSYLSGFTEGAAFGIKQSEQMHKIEERVRILKALRDKGSTGDYLEIPWQDVLDIFDPAEEKK